MRLIRFHTSSNEELVFLSVGVVRRALRREQPDQHVMASLRSFPIWQSSSKRGQPCCMGAASSIFRKYSDHEMFIST
jgi:hypothetical protein